MIDALMGAFSNVIEFVVIYSIVVDSSKHHYVSNIAIIRAVVVIATAIVVV